MKVTRRQFMQGGVAAFTVTFAAPEFLSDLAQAQGARFIFADLHDRDIDDHFRTSFIQVFH